MSVNNAVDLSRSVGLTNISKDTDMRRKSVFITGGADGIGRAVAKAYHKMGATVVVVDIQEEKLNSLVEELGGERIHAFPFDLRTNSKSAYDQLEKKVRKIVGGCLDVYLINAGIIKKSDGQTIATTPIDEFDDMAAINVRSHIVIYQKLLPMLEKSKAGRIVLTSSPIVGRTDPASANYAWTKKALENNVATIRKELENTNIMVAGYVPPPVQAWLRAHWKNEPVFANPLPEDVIELPLRLGSATLDPKYNGKMFTYVDKRKKNIQPKDGGEVYDANDRTENGFDLGIRIRDIGKGGGVEGDSFMEVYDTWEARQLMGSDPVPEVDENLRLKSVHTAPDFIKKALQ